MRLNPKTCGYTLIEILMVLFIISIVTSVALLSMGQNKNKEIESFTQEIVQMVRLAEEQALLQPAVVGLAVNGHALEFSQFQGKAWLPWQDALFGTYRIPTGIQVRVKINDQAETNEKNVPPIIISTSGDMTPFTIYVGKVGEAPRYAISGEADGKITTTSLS